MNALGPVSLANVKGESPNDLPHKYPTVSCATCPNRPGKALKQEPRGKNGLVNGNADSLALISATWPRLSMSTCLCQGTLSEKTHINEPLVQTRAHVHSAYLRLCHANTYIHAVCAAYSIPCNSQQCSYVHACKFV